MKKCAKFWTAIAMGAAIAFSFSFGLILWNTHIDATAFADEGEEEGGEISGPEIEEPLQVSVPVLMTGLVYNGYPYHIADYFDYLDEVITLSGDVEATDADYYSVYLTLPDEGYVWSDPAFNGQIDWQIQKAEISLSLDSRIYIYNGGQILPRASISAGIVDMDSDKGLEQYLAYSGDIEGVAPGFYEMEVKIIEGSALDQNYALVNGKETFLWVIKGSAEEKMLRVVWDLPAGGKYLFNGDIQAPTLKTIYNEDGNEENIANYEIRYTGDRSSIWAGDYRAGVVIEDNSGTPIRVIDGEIFYSILKNNGVGDFGDMVVVTFVVNGGSQVLPQLVLKGGNVEKPEDPKRNGYSFVGWFKDKDCVTPFNFAHDTVSEAMTLYAGWFENEKKSDDDLLTLMGCNSSVSASLVIAGGMLVLGVSAIAIKKKSNKK